MVHKFLEHGAVKIESGEGEKVYKRTTISITKAKKVEDEKTWVQRVKRQHYRDWKGVGNASRDTGEAAMLQEFNTKI